MCLLPAVLDVYPHGSFQVFFVDYGLSEFVRYDQIYCLEDRELLDFPPQSFCVCLDDVSDRKLGEDDYKKLKSIDAVAIQIRKF